MSSFKANIQKLGRAMLLPVAAMPLAGLIMRLSADDMLNIPVIGAAGNAVFGNLDILFAIGVTIGFAKTKDKGIPALTGFLAIATLKKGLEIMNPAVSMGIFGGIISGLVAAWTYNRFKNQKLPMVFSYFAGEKFPLTMVMILQTITAVVFGVIWPIIQTGIDSFAKLLVDMGAFGVGIFMFLNRLLIPFGLHHVLNTYVYYDLGSYTSPSGEVFRGEMTRFINGDPQAGLFLSGFFVVMMFGIPAICLAIYRAAFKENKEMVKGIMGSGAATSFIANITEPVEFSFMFISPMLYVVHAFFAGLAGFVCYLFNIRIGFTFGACIVDYLINFRIATNAILILPIGLVFFALYYFTFYYLIKKRNIPTLGREVATEFGTETIEEEEKELTLASKNYEYMAKKLLDAFGGAKNIADAYSCNTRLRVEVLDSSVVNEQRIKQLGVSGIIKPTEKNYQVIVGLEVTYIMAEFDKLLENQG
ncbi:PTS transporter subunit EIIC [Enterococcus sp. DIV0242_7C1]|uniref:PTS system N-acetylglucosamine-specific IIABC component n=1 Tax=Candidatus Enterococcus dunnyi TaxID=1834192 RepID=A0A200J6E6_9ENTE|nr:MULTISPECIES: PTS transporter subunit EIIC [unclassified Enterococcus]MBO0471649.1 PTS transporter subunit EIIC [Enterococcus sp. DIV0242_7C1]OUZ32812.1 PTS system N-acetylglucosamine-specific IIABC component [Enterococcus sp. 9D6_DIV0238]